MRTGTEQRERRTQSVERLMLHIADPGDGVETGSTILESEPVRHGRRLEAGWVRKDCASIASLSAEGTTGGSNTV